MTTKAICWSITFLALASLVAWAGFDVTWWKPLSDVSDARGFALTILHILAMMAGPAYWANNP